MAKLKTYLKLMRPANIVTSVADIVAGAAIAFYLKPGSDGSIIPLFYLCLSTACLYAGGIVFNDVFDAEIDRVERPERPIPSNAVSLKQAVFLGSVLLLAGVAAAWAYSGLSAFIALLIALCALLYDKFGKHHAFLGPLNMGMCRGLNLLLGLSIVPEAMQHWGFISLIPIIYIYSITMISRGEVYGSTRKSLYLAGCLYALVLSVLLVFSVVNKQLLLTLVFALPFCYMIYKPLIKAIQQPIGRNIGLAVKGGVIALILMDAGWAAAFQSAPLAVIIVLLLPISMWLAKIFAVT